MPAAIHNIVNAFDTAPVPNPDGSEGINLHVDAGIDVPLTWGDAATWGSLSGGNALPYQQNLGTYTADNYNWTQFDQLKVVHFDEACLPIFHYNIWANQLCPEFEATSGISRGDGASDFIVSLGGWAGSNGTQAQQAGTFMHELGHNPGLKHGGADELNYKPNYLSIMNYSFQMTGLYVNDQTELFDYSRYNLPALDETDLDENKGISPAPTLTLGTRFFCGSPFPGIDLNASQVDWNCSGVDTDFSVSSNINRGYAPDTTLSVLTTKMIGTI
jgi:hypothetical protein